MLEANFDTKDINPITLRLLEGQVDIILNALELYGNNLDYMLNTEDLPSNKEEIERKRVMFKCTYEQIRLSKLENLGVGEGELSLNFNNTEKQIIKLIRENKFITQPEIAKILNLSENCIYRNIKSLKEKNFLNRIGSNKNGHWEIRDNFRDKFKDNSIDFDLFLEI